MLDHLGLPCVDMIFLKRTKAVYLYQSSYDSYFWVKKFGDPGFNKRLAMARLFGVLAVLLAGGKVISFKAAEYSTVLMEHTCALASKSDVCLRAIEKRLERFFVCRKKLDSEVRILNEKEPKIPTERTGRSYSVVQVNKRYMSIERAFLKDGGLPGWPLSKHTVFAPGLWLGYQGVVFPGLIEALHDNGTNGANIYVLRIARAVEQAAEAIET